MSIELSTETFYERLPCQLRFFDLTDPRHFVPVPEDWYILVTDIVDSTQAIANGKYKDVNLLGASSIAAVLNAVEHLDVPFMFGGDGATLLVPPSVLPAARDALLATRAAAKQRFDLELRVGIVPVQRVLTQTTYLSVAKAAIAPGYCQASFTGGGLTYATNLVKDPRPDNPYRLDTHTTIPADFTGMECRWQDVPSPQGQTLSLIVLASPNSRQSTSLIYKKVLTKIRSLYGAEDRYRPVRRGSLSLSFNPRHLMAESNLRSHSQQVWARLRYLGKILLENLLGWLLMAVGPTIGNVNWGSYKQDVVAATDFQKFDDRLQMVIASSPKQTAQLRAFLDEGLHAGELTYGLHVSDRALLTCLVLDCAHNHIHFVDAADGGYAVAAAALKTQLQHKTQNWKSYVDLSRRKHLHPRPQNFALE